MIIYTNKNIKVLSGTNGHSYRLIKLQEHDTKNKIQLTNNFKNLHSNKSVLVIDVPGLSFFEYYNISKKFDMYIVNIFLQDSFFVYSKNKLKTYFKYRFSVNKISRSLINLVYSFLNELLISLYFNRVGYVSSKDYFLPKIFSYKYFTVKNGIDVEKCGVRSLKKYQKEIRLFFWGDMDYPPNIDSLLIFLQKYWISLQKEFSNIELHIYGKLNNNTILEVKSLNFKSVYFEGVFDKHQSMFENNDIFINFVQYGAGIKNKTLEALACEVPMISTHHALEGIDEVCNYKYIYSNISELKKSMHYILEDNNLKELAQYSDIVRGCYTWEKSYYDYIRGATK